MLLIRGLIFTGLVPFVIGVLVWIDGGTLRRAAPWSLGWGLIAAGALVYSACLARFLSAGGTPAIFFTRKLRALIGEEPRAVVSGGLYAHSRNPMYLAVLSTIAGEELLRASAPIAIYGVLVFVAFHVAVVVFEEPHLRKTRGPEYDAYCRAVPRWIGRRRRFGLP